MKPTDITVEILKSIRDELRETRIDLSARLDLTNTRLDTMGTQLGDTNTRVEGLARRQVEVEVRLATELASVTFAVQEVRDVLREDLGLRRRVDDHEQRLAAIERR